MEINNMTNGATWADIPVIKIAYNFPRKKPYNPPTVSSISTKNLYFVATHPEVAKGGFTKIKEPIEFATKTGIGFYLMPGSTLEKEVIANYKKFRIFETGDAEKTARALVEYLKEHCEGFLKLIAK